MIFQLCSPLLHCSQPRGSLGAVSRARVPGQHPTNFFQPSPPFLTAPVHPVPTWELRCALWTYGHCLVSTAELSAKLSLEYFTLYPCPQVWHPKRIYPTLLFRIHNRPGQKLIHSRVLQSDSVTALACRDEVPCEG